MTNLERAHLERAYELAKDRRNLVRHVVNTLLPNGVLCKKEMVGGSEENVLVDTRGGDRKIYPLASGLSSYERNRHDIYAKECVASAANYLEATK